jgi:hypothetical protein
MTERYEEFGSGLTFLIPEPGECVCQQFGLKPIVKICNSCERWWCNNCTPNDLCPHGPVHVRDDIING